MRETRMREDFKASGVTDAAADALVMKYGRVVYPEREIRKVFPEIKATDQKIYQCRSAAANAIVYEYADRLDENQVRVKKLNCREVESGRECLISQEVRYFSKDLDRTFVVLGGGSIDRAMDIASAYYASLPAIKMRPSGREWNLKRYKLVSIEGSDQGSSLALDGCECFAQLAVGDATEEGKLEIIESQSLVRCMN